MATTAPKPAESAYAKWQQTVSARYADRSFVARNRSGVELDPVYSGLDRITETGIVFDGREYEVDCIIYASGFEVATPPDRTAGFDMHGVGGISLSDYWADGRKSLHGMLVHNFPNMGIISGLKQAGITWNITFMNRRQAEHFAALVKRNLDAGTTFDVTPEAEQAWLDVLADKAMKDTTFLRECTPGYYNNEGKNERDSIWVSNYGGGPFEYMDILRDWIGDDVAIARDLALTPAA